MQKLFEFQFHSPNIHTRTSKLRTLISNSFGRRKNDPVKDRKAVEIQVSLRGYSNGGDRQTQ